jgi:hypothetical protein
MAGTLTKIGTNIFHIFLVYVELNLYLFLQLFAWKVADQLLHTRRNLRSCLYGAKVLREKIQFAFDELPPEAYTPLRESMFDMLGNNFYEHGGEFHGHKCGIILEVNGTYC